MTRKLTRDQLAAIHAAQRAGVSKRQMFEFEVQKKQFNSLPKEEQEKLIENATQGKSVSHPKMTPLNINSVDKAVAIIRLQRNEEARKAFIKEDSLRFQRFRAKELR